MAVQWSAITVAGAAGGAAVDAAADRAVDRATDLLHNPCEPRGDFGPLAFNGQAKV